MRDDLMKRLHETLPGIETPVMRGDNFALLLCGHFDDGEPNSDNDSGWSDSAENGYNEVIAAIRAHYEPAAARIAELEALVSSEVSQRYRDCAALLARAEAAEAQVAKLVEALTDHNYLLRSAMQIAKREGVEGQIASTNWDAYYNRVAVVLKRHHATANKARATLSAVKQEAGE